MTTGYVPYMTLGEIEITHTCSENESEIMVYFEEPDEQVFFKTLKVSLHDFRVEKNEHFNSYEVDRLLRFCVNNYNSIVEYAKVGGIAHA